MRQGGEAHAGRMLGFSRVYSVKKKRRKNEKTEKVKGKLKGGVNTFSAAFSLPVCYSLRLFLLFLFPMEDFFLLLLLRFSWRLPYEKAVIRSQREGEGRGELLNFLLFSFSVPPSEFILFSFFLFRSFPACLLPIFFPFFCFRFHGVSSTPWLHFTNFRGPDEFKFLLLAHTDFHIFKKAVRIFYFKFDVNCKERCQKSIF